MTATVATGARTEHAFTWGEGDEARQLRARAARMEDGRPAVWLADITEEALRCNEARLLQALSAASGGSA